MSHEDEWVNHWLNDASPPVWKEQVEMDDADSHADSHADSRAVHSNKLTNAGESVRLSVITAGSRVRIVALDCGDSNSRFMGMGLIPGAVLEVMNCIATGSVIVALQDHRLGLSTDMAEQIHVVPVNLPINSMDANRAKDQQGLHHPDIHSAKDQQGLHHPDIHSAKVALMQLHSELSATKLRQIAVGSRLRVVGYEPASRDYKRKLLAMGLTPGTELVVTRHAPLGDPTEIEVRGFHLTLRKDEADALIVTLVSGE
jgi:ferrous iron transport protein A